MYTTRLLSELVKQGVEDWEASKWPDCGYSFSSALTSLLSSTSDGRSSSLPICNLEILQSRREAEELHSFALHWRTRIYSIRQVIDHASHLRLFARHGEERETGAKVVPSTSREQEFQTKRESENRRPFCSHDGFGCHFSHYCCDICGVRHEIVK